MVKKMTEKKGMLIPSVIDIETVHGFCNASCPMCNIENSKKTSRLMSNVDCEILLNKLVPYKDGIDILTFVGMGEPLIDKGLGHKISVAKKLGFKNVKVITNVALLNESKAKELLSAGLDEIIFSIDSLYKKTLEKSRPRLIFEVVMKCAHGFIKLRNEGGYATNVQVRIIEQDLNKGEWGEYSEYWLKQLSIDSGDMILRFPEHNWANSPTAIEKNVPCAYVFDRLAIGANGDIQFCCIDSEADFFDLGNVFENDPVQLFNGNKFRESRHLMENGNINEIDPCVFCDVPIKRLERDCYIGPGGTT